VNTVTLNRNRYVSMSYTGLHRRNTLFVFVWLRHSNTWIRIQHVGCEWSNGAEPQVGSRESVIPAGVHTEMATPANWENEWSGCGSYMLNTRNRENNTVFYSYFIFSSLFCEYYSPWICMYPCHIHIQGTGWHRRKTLFVFVWLRHRNACIIREYVFNTLGVDGQMELELSREWVVERVWYRRGGTERARNYF